LTVNTDHAAAPDGGASPPGGQPKTTVSDLIRAGCDFTDVPVVAGILRCDMRTVRRRIEDGTIPAVRIGTTYRIPVRWLREAAGVAA
jgi:excisionase family DNA binding protein